MKALDRLSDDDLLSLIQRAAALPDAPASVRRAVIDLFQPARPAFVRIMAQSIVERVIAVLTFDSWNATPLAAGVRSSPSGARHLLFSASGRDVDLRIAGTADQFVVSGQVLGPDEAGVIELVQQALDPALSPAPRVASIDELGEFSVDGLLPGTYVVTLRLGTNVIVLPAIDVGDRKP